MKKSVLTTVMMLSAIVASAKDIKTVVLTTNPQMHCESCENKIKGNLKFEKGIKNIETNVKEQKVTVKYDADKTSADNIMAAFSKFGYTAQRVNGEQKDCCKEGNRSCCQGQKNECKAGEKSNTTKESKTFGSRRNQKNAKTTTKKNKKNKKNSTVKNQNDCCNGK
jgi:periplasmic mercuric ion binding protein